MVVYSPMKENTLDQTKLRQAFGCFATGIAVITALGLEDEPIGMTVNSFSSLSLNPALLLWSIQKNSAQFDDFIEADFFNVHILSDTQAEISSQFAKKEVDRFEDVEWLEDENKVPLLKDCHGVFQCRGYQHYQDAGDHAIVVGEVLAAELDESEPLLFYRGSYRKMEKK